MARPITANHAQVILGLNAAQSKLVNKLVELGYYGRTPAEVCMYLFNKSLRKVTKKLNNP